MWRYIWLNYIATYLIKSLIFLNKKQTLPRQSTWRCMLNGKPPVSGRITISIWSDHGKVNLSRDLNTQGKPIDPNDMLIAAVARTFDAVLVTHNTGEFSRVSGLQLDDWELS
jgi:hypothetical protein